ncbi:hypothetical protein [Nocardia sp. CC227C]|uniref:hypothetical protein n=1 Tax=Nocardia sp. CC227C TaxID=3044562 RepID=UPI00278BD9FF|nr:hypothetical protein [Nocardia sp. CC227C]
MNKVGDQPISAGASDRKLTGWTERSGFTGSVIANDELVVGDSGPIAVQCRIQLTADWSPQFGGLLTVRLLHNGSEVRTANFANGTAALALPSTTIAVQAGDRLSVVLTNSTANPVPHDATVQGGSNTYLYFDAA